MRFVEIEATNRCNTHCVHCPREAITRPLGTMSWEVFQEVIDQVSSPPEAVSVNFSGMGEPTINPHLPRFIRHLTEREIDSRITTNASTLTSDRIRELMEAGLKHVIVSFNGHNTETFQLTMGGLSFEKASQGVRDLVRLGEGTIGLSANVSSILQTRPHLPAIKSYLNELGIHDILFAQCHNRGGHMPDPSVCQTPLPPRGNGRCDTFVHTLYVAWNGQVLPCCHDLAGEGVIGDLTAEDLTTIMERKDNIAKTGVRFPMCKECNDLYRFSREPTPDGTPLSDWIYMLYSEDSRAEKLIETIRERDKRIEQQERRIQELKELIAAYESGWFMRFSRSLKELFSR